MAAGESKRVNILVAAVGNSDVAFGPPANGTQPEGGKRRIEARALGQEALRRLEQGEPVEFRIPLLKPVVAGLAQAGERPDRIVLVATDQAQATPEHHRASDTVHYAELVKQRLQADYGLPDASVETVLLRDNPADYGRTFPFARELYARLRAAHRANTTCHIALTGGTPALTAALLIEGIAAFGAAARVHYLDRGGDTARTLDVVQDLQAQALRRALQDHIGAHAYAAAGLLCDTDPAFAALLPDEPRRLLVRALLQHAAHRLNANLTGARDALTNVDLTLLTDHERETLTLLAPGAGASEEELDAQTIREVIASAEVMFGLEHYFDFITRAGTFFDTFCKYVAVHRCGAVLSPIPGKSGQSLEPWIKQQPDLLRYLEKKQTKFGGVPTQFLYKRVVGFSAKQNSAWQPLADALNDHRLERLSGLRNGSVHRYDSITRMQMQQAWDGEPAEIVPELRRLAALAGIDRINDSPYAVVQTLLVRLISPGDSSDANLP